VVLNVDMSRVGRAELRESATVLADHDDGFIGAVISRSSRLWRRKLRPAQGVFAKPCQPIERALGAPAGAVAGRAAVSGHIAAVSSLASHASWSRAANEVSEDVWRDSELERTSGASAVGTPSP
jgi:hypothetical protein